MIDLSSGPRVALGAYVSQARQWLEAMNPRFGGAARHGLSQEDDLVLGRAFQKAKSEAGYACITLPRELGGAVPNSKRFCSARRKTDSISPPTTSLSAWACLCL